jgi:hypothetical protein
MAVAPACVAVRAICLAAKRPRATAPITTNKPVQRMRRLHSRCRRLCENPASFASIFSLCVPGGSQSPRLGCASSVPRLASRPGRYSPRTQTGNVVNVPDRRRRSLLWAVAKPRDRPANCHANLSSAPKSRPRQLILLPRVPNGCR